jgi:anti-sigma factor RsiW
MSCDEIRELFSDHLDGALSVEDEDRFGRHVGECTGCREALARYETGVGTLAGSSPEPPSGLGEGLTRRLESEGLLRPSAAGARWWLPMAAALATVAIGLIVGRSMAVRDDDARGSRVSPLPWADACTRAPLTLPPLDPRVWRALPDPGEPERVVLAGHYTIRLPRRLVSHGPYDPDAFASVAQEGSTCLPLHAPPRRRLALSVAPAPTGSGESAETFAVEIDPQRVLYARVIWERHGLIWSLEGRAEATDLLDVAREIAGRARVERTERGEAGQTL